MVNHSGTFTGNGWTQEDVEPCLFTFWVNKVLLMIALVWTDDVAFGIKKSPEGRKAFSDFMVIYGKRWVHVDKGPIKTFVGFCFERSSSEISISLPHHIAGIYEDFAPSGTAPTSMPAASQDALNGVRLAADDNEREKMKPLRYLAAVASMLYYVLGIRPDCVVVIVALCQVAHDPAPTAWDVLLGLISYCYHTRSAKIVYRRNPKNIPKEFDGSDDEWKLFKNNFLFHNWVDGSWKIPSVAGHLTMMCDGPLDWGSKLIKVTCHSSAETEISAGSIVCKNSMYLRQLTTAMGLRIIGAIPTFIDNTAAIDITGKMGTSKRTAHFLRWQHYLRWCVAHHYVRLIYVSTKRQLADALTKVIDKTLFLQFRDMVLVVERD